MQSVTQQNVQEKKKEKKRGNLKTQPNNNNKS